MAFVASPLPNRAFFRGHSPGLVTLRILRSAGEAERPLAMQEICALEGICFHRETDEKSEALLWKPAQNVLSIRPSDRRLENDRVLVLARALLDSAAATAG